MKINGYKQNCCKYNTGCIYNKGCSYNKNCIKGPSCLCPLFEVENFLCNFKKAIKCVNLYKFLK